MHERKPNRTLEEAGFRVPKPCRSDQFPSGLPELKGLDKIRTEAANEVYGITAKLVRELVRLVSMHHREPHQQPFWKVPCIAQ